MDYPNLNKITLITAAVPAVFVCWGIFVFLFFLFVFVFVFVFVFGST